MKKFLALTICTFILISAVASADTLDIASMTTQEKRAALAALLADTDEATLNALIEERVTSYASDSIKLLQDIIAAEAATRNDLKEPVLLQNGSKGEDVKVIQQRLKDLNYLNGTVDGSFGKGTEAAVRAFQGQAGLSVTGIVDQTTYDVLLASEAPEAPAAAKVYTAAELYKKFEANKIAAKGELSGTVIEVSGKVYAIDEDLWGNPRVELFADSYGWETIDCYFSEKDLSSLAGLSKGQAVVIRGTCDDMSFMAVDLQDCEIIG